MTGTNSEDNRNNTNQNSENTELKYDEKLFSQSVEKYGDKYKDHYLDIYKIFVATTDKISDRRQSSNSFFLTLNTAIITVISYLQLGTKVSKNTDFYWLVSLSGIIICFAWYRIIRSYQDLNSGKFKIIHLMEKNLPIAVYDAEWEALDQGNNPKTYLQFSKIEILIPLMFLGIHIIVLIRAFPWNLIMEFIIFAFQ